MTSFTKSKWHQKEENQQSMTITYINSEGDQDTSTCKISGHSRYVFFGKCPETPNWPVSQSQSGAKRKKSTDYDHNLISSEVGQDTSACEISGHSLPAFSGKCLEPPNLTLFTKAKWHQKEKNQQTVTLI